MSLLMEMRTVGRRKSTITLTQLSLYALHRVAVDPEILEKQKPENTYACTQYTIISVYPKEGHRVLPHLSLCIFFH